jgi:FKBP-type peptidyl-prolyl cis-trans isomerase FkpA
MKYKKLLNLALIIAAASLFLTSCFKENDIPSAAERLANALKSVDKTQLESDLKIIDDSLQKWFLTAEKEPNGVRYIVHSQGSGSSPSLTSTIKFNYVGRLLSTGEIFDDGTLTYPLDELIMGWQTTMPLLNEGAKATLYIPSGLAYGPVARTDASGNVVIPANANIVFEIELIDVL